MAGITIIDAKIVGICSKCRKEGDDIPRWKNGEIIPDEDIACLSAALGDANCTKDVTESEDNGK